MIDPERIPQFTGNLDQLEADIADLKSDGSAIAKTGTDTNAAFQGLSAYYQAPEAERLFATTRPVATAGATFQSDAARVTDALSTYATEVRPLAIKLADLRSRAHAFVAGLAHDKDWQYDGDKVNQDNQLRSEVDATVAAFWEAERRCANAIEAIFGGTRFIADDGSDKPDMYGYTAKELDEARGLPWGDPVEQEFHWYDIGHWSWSFVKGFAVDGVWGTLKSVGGLAGLEGWDTLVRSWKGLGEIGIGLASYQFVPPLGPDEKNLPGWLRDSRRTTVAAGKAMIGWDEWSKDPARAAGGVTFNVVAVAAGGGEADGAAAAGDAGRASMAARAMGALDRTGHVVDPMTYVGGEGGFPIISTLTKVPRVSVALDSLSTLKAVSVARIGDHLANLRTALPDGDAAHLPGGEPGIPSRDPITAPDGTIRLPDGSRLTAEGTYHFPGETTAAPQRSPIDTDVPSEPIAAPTGQGALHHGPGDLGERSPQGELALPTHGDEPVAGHPAAGEHAPSDTSGSGADHHRLDGGHLSPAHGAGHRGEPEQAAVAGPPGDVSHTPPVGPGNLPDGSWEGPNGLRLSPGENSAAEHFLTRAVGAEPQVTGAMESITHHVHDARLNGLDYRLKGEDSLKRKIATAMHDNPALTTDEALANIKDSLRYTVEIPTHDYTGGVRHAVADLRDRGFENITFKNTWNSPGYKGINSTWRDPDTGQVFEVQFHTPESFTAKMDTHILYERGRLPGVSPEEQRSINAEQDELFRQVPVPGQAAELRADAYPPLSDGPADATRVHPQDPQPHHGAAGVVHGPASDGHSAPGSPAGAEHHADVRSGTDGHSGGTTPPAHHDGGAATADWFDDRGSIPPSPQTHPVGHGRPGFSIMREDDQFYRNFRHAKPLPGHYDVVAHGTMHNTIMDTAGGRELSPRELADMVRRRPDYRPGTPIRLLSCNTGHLEGTFAQQLARDLKVPVTAPDGYAYVDGLGRLGVDRALRLNVSDVRNLANTFYRFHPGGYVERLPRSEWAGDQ